jgi:hypothetical protein
LEWWNAKIDRVSRPNPGWHFGRKPHYARPRLGPSEFRSDYWYIVVPLWAGLLVFAVPTALLWYRDRRRFPPDHCLRCGYDVTGNVSGVCPECGRKAP